jgi:hypothetical protein
MFLWFLCLVVAVPGGLPAAAANQGPRTVADYSARLDQAKRGIDEVIERESPAPALINRMNAFKRLLPVNEEVEFGGAVIRINNAWFHETLDKVIENAGGDIEQRHSMLREVSDRLTNLERSVKGARVAGDEGAQDQRARLNNILARPEYQPAQEKESMLQGWINKIKNFIYLLLQKLLGGSSTREQNTGLVTLFRALVFLAAVAFLVFGAVKLAQRLHRLKKAEGGSEAREILGEEMAEEATAADLFSQAVDLARQGEYRKAIRRTYVALLCELEQRGKLRLHRTKTNRDYIDAMRSEQLLFPRFSVITNSFERVWYGQEGATEEEFKKFVALYRETVK